jgi:hypothetical protein
MNKARLWDQENHDERENTSNIEQEMLREGEEKRQRIRTRSAINKAKKSERKERQKKKNKMVATAGV